MVRFGNGRKRTEVGLLALSRVRVPGPALHPRREILDADDFRVFGEHVLAECAYVEPPLGSVLEAAVVKVEAVHVDDGAQTSRFASRHGRSQSRGAFGCIHKCPVARGLTGKDRRCNRPGGGCNFSGRRVDPRGHQFFSPARLSRRPGGPLASAPGRNFGRSQP
jgi:hypothetical protein